MTQVTVQFYFSKFLLDKFIWKLKAKKLGNRKLFGHEVLSLVSGNGVVQF